MAELIGASTHLSLILQEVADERRRQDSKWGEQNHPMAYWLGILMEEVGEAAKDVIENKPVQSVVTELVQTMAVAAAMIECMERNDMKTALEIPKLAWPPKS